MFYCDKCATEKKWPHSLSASYGNCEVCGVSGRCNDVPSTDLPRLYEVLNIKTDEFFVMDADVVDPNTASRIAEMTHHFVILVKGGIKNIATIDRKALRAVLDNTEPKENASV